MKKTIALILFISGILSLNAQETAHEIMRKSYDLPEAYTFSSNLQMILINKGGRKKNRLIKMYTKKTEEGTDSFVEFMEPADVRGTKFLTIGNTAGEDDQRLYLPALKRVRRIASSGKNGRFMGSDLTFYDMEERVLEDFTYTLLGEEDLSGKKCWLIEAIPTEEDSPYSKSRLWVSQEDYYVYKREVYEPEDGLLKTFAMVEVQKIQGIFQVIKMGIENHQDNTKTLIVYSNPQINIPVDQDLFTERNLQR